MMYYLILALVLIIAYALLYFAAKNWHWLDITALAIFLPMLLLFFTLSMMVLKTLHVHRTAYQSHKEKLADAVRNNEVLRHGHTITADGEIKRAESGTWLTKVREELGRTLYDRGRVWPNCLIRGFDGTKLQVETSQWGDELCSGAEPPSLEEAGDGAEAQLTIRKHGIEEKTVLYLFAQVSVSQLEVSVQEAVLAGTANADEIIARGERCALPTMYLGEYLVAEQQEAGVVLQPTIPLSAAQQEVINNPNSPCVLYEMMPMDTHVAFEGMNEQNKRALFPEELVDEYIRDGQTADRDSDPPERTLVQVQFKEAYNDIMVDAPDEPPRLPSRDFNALGQALPAWLRHGGDGDAAGRVQFQVGEMAFFDTETAQQLVQGGIAEEVDRIYIRQLRDYEFLFHKIYRQSTIVDDRTRSTQDDITRLEQATARTQQSIDYRTEETGKLTHDKQGFERERGEINRYHESLNVRYQKSRQELSALYRESLALANQLKAESQRVEDLVKSRTQRLGTLTP